MSAINIKTRKTIEMELKLESIQLGQIDFNMNTQFDETVLESALANVGNMDDEFWIDSDNLNIMAVAHNVSSWTPPELNQSWID